MWRPYQRHKGEIESEAKSAVPAIEEWQKQHRRHEEAEKALEMVRGLSDAQQ